MNYPSRFPSDPYEGQIFYDADTDRTFEYQRRDILDRMINRKKDDYFWVDISDEPEKTRDSSGSLRF